MKLLIALSIAVIGVCVNSSPIISTENAILENRSCDVTLNFSSMGLSIVNPNFISNPYIKNLTLRNNSISYFQENTFDSLPSLAVLDLSNNELTVDDLFSFGSLYTLKSLTLDNNPDSLSTVINRPYTPTRRPTTTTTPRTTTSRYYRSRTTADPYNYYQHSTESYSNTYGCSRELYKDVGDRCYTYYSELEVKYNYPNLNYLSIRNIFINSLASDWARHFPQLTHLDISENNFYTTSGEIFNHIPTTVTSLTMRNVKLTSLEISPLQNITHLDLNENKFYTLSNHYCFDNTLCLENGTNLESLHLANCSIRKIDIDAFKGVNKLNYLDLSGNDFEEIPDGTFEYLPALSHLDLSNNNLVHLPDFSSLLNLTSLYMDKMQHNDYDTMSLLSSNGLEKFSELPKLEVLSLRFNGLKTIPSSFLNKLPKLLELNLSNNQLKSLPAWQWQNNLCSLLLSNNEFEHFEDISLKEAESLQHLHLENNKFTGIKLKSLKHLPDDVILKFSKNSNIQF